MENSYKRPTMTFLNFGDNNENKLSGLSVSLRNENDTGDKLIKRFNRKIHKDGVLKHYCQRCMYYQKPSKVKHDKVNKVLFIENKKKMEQKKK